jgi:hypothetical protein|tara:strand:+ start:18211 stop:18327 length:117 start_codon:yes stop_codon:yes gene_type:complete
MAVRRGTHKGGRMKPAFRNIPLETVIMELDKKQIKMDM